MLKLICFVTIFGFYATNVIAGGQTLVLLDNLAIRETHSIFFKSLQGMNPHRHLFSHCYKILFSI